MGVRRSGDALQGNTVRAINGMRPGGVEYILVVPPEPLEKKAVGMNLYFC
jgi:hypothetical protein